MCGYTICLLAPLGLGFLGSDCLPLNRSNPLAAFPGIQGKPEDQHAPVVSMLIDTRCWNDTRFSHQDWSDSGLFVYGDPDSILLDVGKATWKSTR